MSSLSITSRGLLTTGESPTLTIATLGFLEFTGDILIIFKRIGITGNIQEDLDFKGTIPVINLEASSNNTIPLEGKVPSCDDIRSETVINNQLSGELLHSITIH